MGATGSLLPVCRLTPDGAMSDHLKQLRRYADLVRSLLTPQPFAPESESAASIQVERGTILTHALLDEPLDDRLDPLLRQPPGLRVVDRQSHHRPVYGPLLAYAALSTFRLCYETLPRDRFGLWEESLRTHGDHLERRLGDLSFNPAAANGAQTAEAAWVALCLQVAGKLCIRDAWTDLAGDFFGKLTQSQQPSGAFLAATPSDNPETTWYHELTILHAAASFAAQAENRTVAAAVKRNTTFHLNETQPDHASNQPWALFAFLWNPLTLPLADGILHAAQTQHPGGVTGLTQVLLADSLQCLRLF
jgi:hypothetical protein